MKPVAEWDEAYIMNLPPGEHDWLEFKNSNMLDLTMPKVIQDDVLNELAKQVSAFANSGGGTIVYGVEDKTKAISNGGIPLTLKGRASTKEWLEDVIPRLVEFPLQKFNVYEVHNSSPSSNIAADKCLILVDIPDSDAAPHQSVRDKHYYARVGGKTVPIGHRHIVDIMGRAKHPNLIPVMFYFYESTDNIFLYGHFVNKGKVLARHVTGYIYLPFHLFTPSITDNIVGLKGKEYKEFYFNNLTQEQVGANIDLKTGVAKEKFYISRHSIVLPGQLLRGIAKIDKGRITNNSIQNEQLYWKIYADNAPMNKGVIKLIDIKFEAKMLPLDPMGLNFADDLS